MPSNLSTKLFIKLILCLILLPLISLAVIAAPKTQAATQHANMVNGAESRRTIECFVAADLANGNHAPSMKLYGDSLQEGEFCEQDLVKSKYWYKKAYELSDKNAGVELASLYLLNEEEEHKGIALLEELAKQGEKDAWAELGFHFTIKGFFNTAANYLGHPSLANDAQAVRVLGLLHLNQDFSGYDTSKGLSLLLRAVDLGDEISKFFAGEELVYQGDDVKKGISLIKGAATAEVTEAITFLSNYYREKEAVNGNRQEALYWSIRAAANGDSDSVKFISRQAKQQDKTFLDDDAFLDFLCEQMEHLSASAYLPAMETLGTFYEHGQVCYENIDQALLWYEKAYKQGSDDAGLYLASVIRQNVSHTAQNKSIEILKKLADSGHVWASNDLGLLLKNNANFEDAQHYLKYAARHGEAAAYYNLGGLYSDEQSTFFASELAIEAYRNGATHGHLNSQYQYGRLLVEHNVDTEKGRTLIKDAAESGDEQAQFSLGFDFGNSYSEMYAPTKAKYWYLRSILSGFSVAKEFLARLYKTSDEASTEFYIATTLLSQSATEGSIESAMAVANIYFRSENFEKAYHFGDLALRMTSDNPSEKFELLDSYLDLFISLAKVTPLSSRIETLLDEYLELAKRESHSLHQPYYAKYRYYLQLGDESHSKINLSLAIQNADDTEVKKELQTIYQNSYVDELEDENGTGTVAKLNESVANLYDGKTVDIQELTKSFEVFNPEDVTSELTYLVALEGFASYLLFLNDFKATVRVAQIYTDYVDTSADIFGNSYRNDKMRILSLLLTDYESVDKMLYDFNKYSQRKTLHSNPKIQKLMLQSKLNLAHGHNDKAKQSVSSAFTVFTDEIASQGVCYSGFGLSSEEYFQYFSESELFAMAERFVGSLNEALMKYTLGFLRNNCGDTVREFGDLIHLMLKDEEATSLREGWFNVLLATYLYEDMSSQKQTLVNLATLNQIEEQNDRKKFQEYLKLTRELDDKIGENLASPNGLQNPGESVNKLADITQLSYKIKKLENEFHLTGDKNSLTPYRSDNFSVKNLQSKITGNEAVVIISAFEEELIGFYVDKTNFNIVTTDLSKSRYDDLRNTILSSVEQDDVSSSLDLRPFAYKEAFELYDSFFTKFDEISAGHKRILVVSQGVEAIPLSIIPTSELQTPVKTALDFGEYRNVDWFMDKRDILYLANVNMLFSDRFGIDEHFESPKTIGITPYWDEEVNQYSLPAIAEGLLSHLFQGENGQNDFESLPPISESINHVKALTQSKENTMLLGNKASKTSIVSELASKVHDIVVFSTHALADSSRVDMPSLVVKAEDGKGYDLLTTSDISKIDLVAGWVFLIGCNTGRTNFQTDFLSLADSFFLAGAKRVVMTDWPIESKATTELTHILQKQPGSISFTQKITLAQSELRNDRSNVVYAHPMFWGGFRVIGYP